jgi:hypothetical protein
MGRGRAGLALGLVFDQGFCRDCEEEARLEEVEAAASAPRRSG